MRLDKPNLFQFDGNLNLANPRAAVSLRCPHCRQIGSLASMGPAVNYSKHASAPRPTMLGCAASIRICPNPKCQGLVFVLELGEEVEEVLPPEPVALSLVNLPPLCATTSNEAAACHSAGAYRTSVMMVRRLLEEICELNNAQGKNLHQRLESLRSRITLPQVLFEAMSELKALGNDAAHVEAKEYNNISKVESEASIELLSEILKALYQLDGLVSRLQSLKARP